MKAKASTLSWDERLDAIEMRIEDLEEILEIVNGGKTSALPVHKD